jgi:GUN4-like
MEEELINLSIPFESLIAAIESLDFSQLLMTRQMVNWLIEEKQDQAGEDQLISSSQVDYSYLQALLATGSWEQADEETANLMLETTDDAGIMFIENAKNFPISDLNTIDRLWVKYSNGRFGLSVQKRIWQKAGRNIETFGEVVGWRSQDKWIQENNLLFTYAAPVGHLPFIRGGLRREVQRWSAEFFTDSQGEDQFVDIAEPVEAIEMWQVLINLVDDAL